MPEITKIKTQTFLKLLDQVKNIKTDIVVIPKLLFGQNSYTSSIVGVSGSSIVTTMYNEKLKEFEMNPLWGFNEIDINPNYIALETKLINPFLKLVKDSKTDKNIGIDLNEVEYIQILYDRYYLGNGQYETIEKVLYIGEGENYFTIPLMPSKNVLSIIGRYIEAFEGSNIQPTEYTNIDITNDPKLNDILALKASEGGRIWQPDFLKGSDRGTYVMTLTSNMFNLSKGDSIYLTIKTNPYLKNDRFMCSFTVVKPKKKITLKSYIEFYKVV